MDELLTENLKGSFKEFLHNCLLTALTHNALSDDEFNRLSEEVESIDNMTDIEFRAWFSIISEMR